MKVTEFIEQAEGYLVSFEVLPPLKGGGMDDIFNTLDELMEFKPPFIDVTYHREEFIYKQRPSGYYEKASIRKRPGTVGICAAIMHRYGVEAVPHLLCGGFTKEDTENVLIDLDFLDINNVLALRGDARKFDGKFIPEEKGHVYAKDLVGQIEDMNNGIYLDPNIDNARKTDFSIGVAGYPEKHFECPNSALDLKYLKEKIDVGGDYIVTQMFFDNEAYFRFVKECRDIGINVPIIPGIKPITRKYQVNSLPRLFHVNLPVDLVDELEKHGKDKASVQQIGKEWTIQQCRELIEFGVPILHFYTMGKPSIIKAIVAGL